LEINCKTSLADAKTAIDDFLLADALDSLDTVRLAAALQDAAFSLYETRDLFAGGLATQSDVDESTLAYFNAQASVENARWARAIRLANVPAAWTNTNSAGTGASNED